jgi:hypothetical protein
MDGWWLTPGGRWTTICSEDSGPAWISRGAIDVSRLLAWRRTTDGAAEFDYVDEHTPVLKTAACAPPADSLEVEFFHLSDGQVKLVRWSEIDVFVPTPFRASRMNEIIISEAIVGRYAELFPRDDD